MGRLLTICGSALLAVFLLVPIPTAGAQSLEQFERELSDLAARARPSVVKVHVVSKGRGGRERPITVSGVVVDDEGTIATLGSAVQGAVRVEVELLGGERRPARVLGIDERCNVGVLATDPAGLVAIAPSPAGSVRVGAFTLAVGNAFGLSGSVSTGIVSGVDREVQGTGLVGGEIVSVLYYDLVQTTAPINPGDSGGLLVDSKGRMIGMISASFGRSPSEERLREMFKEFARSVDLDRVRALLGALDLTDKQREVIEFLLARFEKYQGSIEEKPSARGAMESLPEGLRGASLGSQGVNFALPADQVLYAVRMIRAHGRVIRLGITAREPEAAVRSQVGLEEDEALIVTRVGSGSPAERAGVEVHDLILYLGGRHLRGLRSMRRAIVGAPPTGPVEVVVLRGGERVRLSLELSAD